MAKKAPAPEEEEEKDAPAEGEAAEGEEGAEGGADAAKKAKKKKLIIIGAAAFVLLLIIGGAAAFFLLKGNGGDEEALAKSAQQGVYAELPEFLLNLNTSSKNPVLLKAKIVLEVSSLGEKVVVESNIMRLMDAFNTYLRELRSSDLVGSAGIQRLREELIVRSNEVLAPTKVKDVLIVEILVQ